MVVASVMREAAKATIVKELCRLIPLIGLDTVPLMKLIHLVLWIFNSCSHTISVSQLSLSPFIQLSFDVVNLEESLLIVIVGDVGRGATHHYRVVSAHWLNTLRSRAPLITHRRSSEHTSRPLAAPAFHLFILYHLVSFDAPS